MVTTIKSQIVLIRCPGLSARSPIVASVLEQAVIELVKRKSAVPVNMGVPQGLYSSWVASKVDEFLDPPFGGAQMTPVDWKNLNQRRETYCTEVADWVDEIVKINADVLLDHESFKVVQARVVRRYPDLWIIELRG